MSYVTREHTLTLLEALDVAEAEQIVETRVEEHYTTNHSFIEDYFVYTHCTYTRTKHGGWAYSRILKMTSYYEDRVFGKAFL